MSISRRSSSASAPFRFEWRPSRWLAGALAALGVLAAFAALASELPRPAAWMLAIAALGRGLYLARCEARRVPLRLAWSASGRLEIEGEAVSAVRLHWRGPLAFLQWRDANGRRRALAWWPDTLPARARRELRLAGARAMPAAPRPSMAP